MIGFRFYSVLLREEGIHVYILQPKKNPLGLNGLEVEMSRGSNDVSEDVIPIPPKKTCWGKLAAWRWTNHL